MKKETLLFIIILFLGTIGQVSADIYLPSLPAIATGLSTKNNLVQWSVSLYMWGFAGSQLIYGPLSDGLGRKALLLFGLTFLVIGSVVCMLAPNITWLLIGRLLQGIGAGGSVICSRACMRDIFSGKNLAKFGSYLAVGAIVIMTIAPLAGGYIQHGFGWRANFVCLTLYSILLLIIVIFKLPETNLHKNKDNLKFKQWKTNSIILFKSPVFIGLSIIISVTYAGILSWITTSPILLQDIIGITPVGYGWISVLTGVAYGVCGFSNGKLVEKFGIRKMLFIGLILMFIGAVSMLALSSIKPLNIWFLVIPVAVFIGATGFIFANSFAAALGPFPKIAGIAGSIFGFMQIFGGAVSSGVLANLHEKNQVPLAVVLVICASVALVTYWRIRKYLLK